MSFFPWRLGGSVSFAVSPVVESIGEQRGYVKRLKIHYIRQSSRKATACIRGRYQKIAIF
jgi:ribosomal protein L19